MREVGKREVGGPMCLLCYPTISKWSPYKSLPLTSKVDCNFFSNLLISLSGGGVRPLFLPSDGSSSTEAVVGFVSHHHHTTSSGGRGLVTCAVVHIDAPQCNAVWMCSPLPVLGSLVISSPASCAKPTCSPGESTTDLVDGSLVSQSKSMF